MNIDRIRYFHVFAETGSLVKASEILHISQPALSKALKLLEQEIGLKLLDSEGRGLKLTTAGETLRKETQPLLTQWLQLADRIKFGEKVSPTRIGTFEVFSTHFLQTLTQYIKLDSLELHEYGPGKLEEALVNGHIDIGITYLPIPKAGIEYVEIKKVRMGVYGLKKFTQTSISEAPFIVPLHPVNGLPSKIAGLDGWPDHKFSRNIKYRVTLMESALELCRQGLGIAYLPSFVVETHNQKFVPKYQLQGLKSPISSKDSLQSVFLVSRASENTDSKLYRDIAKSLRSLN